MCIRDREINYRAMKLLPRGGYLATASCSHFATEELFIKMLRAAAKDAHRQLRQIEVKQQAPDHPILWGVPETNYLKFFLFQAVSYTHLDVYKRQPLCSGQWRRSPYRRGRKW